MSEPVGLFDDREIKIGDLKSLANDQLEGRSREIVLERLDSVRELIGRNNGVESVLLWTPGDPDDVDVFMKMNLSSGDESEQIGKNVHTGSIFKGVDLIESHDPDGKPQLNLKRLI